MPMVYHMLEKRKSVLDNANKSFLRCGSFPNMWYPILGSHASTIQERLPSNSMILDFVQLDL